LATSTAVTSGDGRFARFYLVTPLAYDSLRALGNAVLVLTPDPPMARPDSAVWTRKQVPF